MAHDVTFTIKNPQTPWWVTAAQERAQEPPKPEFTYTVNWLTQKTIDFARLPSLQNEEHTVSTPERAFSLLRAVQETEAVLVFAVVRSDGVVLAAGTGSRNVNAGRTVVTRARRRARKG